MKRNYIKSEGNRYPRVIASDLTALIVCALPLFPWRPVVPLSSPPPYSRCHFGGLKLATVYLCSENQQTLQTGHSFFQESHKLNFCQHTTGTAFVISGTSFPRTYAEFLSWPSPKTSSPIALVRFLLRITQYHSLAKF